ncbi:calpain-10-like [Clavelina lepadiformis]|uniref:Calpain catalytic domain-containing protein n=1 Tax=Clavelina lepadiformis TaxID=159417 RepID=A0ABP0FFB2_CLALP
MLVSSKDDVAICFSESSALDIDCSKVEWIKPHDLCKNPKLFGEHLGNFPLQGQLGNCWFISVCYTLCENVFNLKKIFANNKANFCDKSYDGSWRFTLWDSTKAEWTDVIIDDTIPTVEKRFLFGSNQDRDVFWLPLLEKACAKFYGCYEALSSGRASEAFMLLTGSYCWRKQLLDVTKLAIVKQQLERTLQQKNVMGCLVATDVLCIKEYEQFRRESTDLHYYVIVGVHENAEDTVMKLMNPQRSTFGEGQIIVVPLSQLFGQRAVLTFTTTKMKAVFNECEASISNHDLIGEWQAVGSSGGSINHPSYSSNPQYLVSLNGDSSAITQIFVSLIQNNKRRQSKRKDLEQAIGLHAWKVKSPITRPASAQSLSSNVPDYATSPSYAYAHDVSLFCSLTLEKHLLVIPSTYATNINCSFLLRISTSRFSTVTLLQ